MRKAQLVRLHKLKDKSAKENEQALIKTVESLSSYELVKSMTFDNGKENVSHTALNDLFSIDTFFCDLYCAWQKGGVENANGLIRQYLPKHTDLQEITEEKIYLIQESLNNRPRKSLSYQTPNEIINRWNKEQSQKVVH